MNTLTKAIPYMDLVSLAALLVAAWYLFFGREGIVGSRVKWMVWMIVLLLMFNSLSNSLEWLRITAVLDTMEDYSALFLPVFYFFVIFIFLQELGFAEVKHLRNYLTNVFDSMPSMLVGVDARGRVTQWNSTAAQKTGLRLEEAKGQALSEVYPLLSDQLEHLRYAVEQGKVYVEPRIPRNLDGETRFDDLTIYPLVENGVQGAVIRLDDVTERARIENVMVQTEKMMSVGGLAAGMAHEINNPIGVILLSVQNILRRVSDDLPANEAAARECGTSLDAVRAYLERRSILEFLRDIEIGGRRASEIVENMLQFSRRTESGMIPEDLARVITDTIALARSDYDLKKKYDFKNIQLETDFAEGLASVPLIRIEFEQVLLNLFKNSAQALSTAVGGAQRQPALSAAAGGAQRQPTLSAAAGGRPPKLTIRTERQEPWAVITVTDNGPGIAESVRKRVFEPFFTTKPVGEGTGLGLSVSYMIITIHHKGQLELSSVPGKGTTFTIRIPLERAAGDSAPTTEAHDG